MNSASFRPAGREYGLNLADGTRLVLSPADKRAAKSIDFFARKACLEPASPKLLPETRRLAAFTCGEGPERPGDLLSLDDGETRVILNPPEEKLISGGRGPRRPADCARITEERKTWERLARISAAIGRETVSRGGVLIHSGLAAAPPAPVSGRNGSEQAGILLAGRSGVGKTTASRRLPPPWRSLGDDVTLIVRDGAEKFWAHPFPTWSRFFGEEKGDGSDTWDLQTAVPLRSIFILEQGPDDRAEKIGGGQTLALLSELANQATSRFLAGFPIEKIAAFHRARYENLCALVRSVPAFMLHVRLEGTFWNEIRRVIPD